jgi:osmoprotectant transport system substrate-binding protein/osmoprotectant transport system permease protein
VRYLTVIQGMRDELLRRTAEHAAIVGISVGIALAMGLVLGVVAARHRIFALVSLTLAAAVLNVPSLALFGFLAVWLGFFNPLVSVVGLAVYAVLPILRNTYAGIHSVEPAAVEAATGMGMTGRQMLWRIQLPLATPVIMAGLRQSAVMTVGIGTVAAAVDPRGLGVLIFHALSSYAPVAIVVAAMPAALLGVLTDRVLAGVERVIGRSRLGGGAPAPPAAEGSAA